MHYESDNKIGRLLSTLIYDRLALDLLVIGEDEDVAAAGTL